jgi:pimeloyl-ACP methyl ester carboxylesterase
MTTHPRRTLQPLLFLSTLLAAAAPARAERAVAVQAPGHYAPVNGLQLYYEVHGTPRAGQPPLVLLHGGGSTIGTSFARLLPILARDRQVIALEQQGHGHTADLDRPFSFEQSADDTAALLEHLGVERADVLGFSNGGSIALQLAVRHPHVVRRLVVISAMFRRDACDPAFWASMEHATLESMPAALRQAYLEAAPHPERLRSFHDKSVRRMLDFRDWPRQVIQGIAAPTLVVNGDADVTRPEHAVELFRLLPKAQLAVLPGTNHAAIMERVAWLAPMVAAFLDGPG